jgi:hypothetical protein
MPRRESLDQSDASRLRRKNRRRHGDMSRDTKPRPRNQLPANSSESDEIRIDLYSGFSRIDPAPPHSLVHSLLEYDATVFENAGTQGYRSRVDRLRFWELDFRERLQVPTGVVPLIADRLVRAGLSVHTTDHRTYGAAFAPCVALERQVDQDDRPILAAIQREPMGQIEVHRFGDTIRWMALICQLYPAARVLMPVATKNFAGDVRWKLERSLGGRVYFQHRGRLPRNLRCMVTTFGTMNSLDPRDWDILLLPDPLGALGIASARAMSRFAYHHGRVYAFVPPSSKLSPRDRLWLHVMAGPNIYRDAPECVGVHVLWLRTPSCPHIGNLPALEFKRQAYWRNTRRNDYITAVSRAFAAQDRAKLAKYGAPYPYTPIAIDRPRDPLVVLLVESTEHGRELLRRLPGWMMVDAVPQKSKQPSPAEDAAGNIMTLTAADKYGLRADVLICASGSPGGRNIKRFPATKWNDDDPDALVVDFIDEFDNRAHDSARRRAREALRRGWTSTWLPEDRSQRQSNDQEAQAGID